MIDAYARHAALDPVLLASGMGSLAMVDTLPLDSIVPKIEPGQEDDSYSSSASSPTADLQSTATQGPPPIPKRKGGRKPVRTGTWHILFQSLNHAPELRHFGRA